MSGSAPEDGLPHPGSCESAVHELLTCAGKRLGWSDAMADRLAPALAWCARRAAARKLGRNSMGPPFGQATPTPGLTAP